MSAPAALGALQYRLVRVEPWALTKPGRFAAVYVRGQTEESFVAEVMVEGRPFKIVFQPPEARRRAALGRLRSLAIVLAPILLVTAAVFAALNVSADREDKIALLEAKAARAIALQTRLVELKSDAQLLRSAGADGHRLTDALADLDWLSRARTPGAHIQAVHWQDGLMTVTVRGDTAPVQGSDREVRRAEHPLAPWTFLWGVGRPAGGASS